MTSSPDISVDPAAEYVVLLDDRGRAVGTKEKSLVHDHATPLHLAFSCYLFDGDGSVLVTRRALHKRTWPGAWTNSCCGHPAPGEPIADAVRRRAWQELGVSLDDLRLLLPTFCYRAEMAGVVEHEMCPVYAALTTEHVVPDPNEVAEVVWMPWEVFRADVLSGSFEVSPWCVEQVKGLPADPLHAPVAPESALPPAGRSGRSSQREGGASWSNWE